LDELKAEIWDGLVRQNFEERDFSELRSKTSAALTNQEIIL